MSERRGLDDTAYTALPEGETYQPYVPAARTPTEFSLPSIGFGVLFGIIFGWANAYLGLKAGLTISTSIPVAVMTVAGFKALSAAGKSGSILEANLSQTIARPRVRWPAG